MGKKSEEEPITKEPKFYRLGGSTIPDTALILELLNEQRAVGNAHLHPTLLPSLVYRLQRLMRVLELYERMARELHLCDESAAQVRAEGTITIWIDGIKQWIEDQEEKK